MKKIFILVCTLFSIAAIHAQCPQYVAFDTTVCGNSINKTIDATVLESRLCGDSITIVFDDSATSLSGSTQVYLHTGPEFVPFEGWQNAYTQNAAMQHISTHIWKITFNPRSFYGYSPDSCLNAIALGFTDSGYVDYLKCGSSNDIYVVTAADTAQNTCASATFFTATYTHAPVTYHWNDANTNGVRTFTTGGNYTVTATGVGGCSVTGSVTINLDNKKVSIGDDTIECTTSSYTFVATPGFASYQWLDANAGTDNIHTATNPTGGMYWVQAVDSNGCVSNDTASVHLSATGYLSLPDTLSSCPGIAVSADASTIINFDGDSLVIIYNAAAGLTQLVGDTNVYFHSAPQLYAFAQWAAGDPYTVGNWGQNDGVGRMRSLGNNLWTITIDPQAYYHVSPDTPILGIWMVFRNFDGTLTGKDSSVANNNNIYLYTVPNPPTSPSDEVTGYHKAAGPLTYTWSNNVHTPTDTFTTGGTYHVTVTDGVCTHTDSVVVVFTSSGIINIGADTTVCSTADSVTISAGTGYAHYAWSNGDTTATIKVAGANTYTVTATTALGCVSVGHRKISIGSVPVSLGGNVLKCNNTPTVLTATPGFSSYEWIGRAGIASNTFTADQTGSYWVEAIDSFGCASYDTVTVRYSEVLQLSLQDSFASCPGSLVGLDAQQNIVVNGDSLVIFFNASSTPLAGATKVYMHSGPQFDPAAGWAGAYTVGNWGQDDGVGKMDSLGNEEWSITIFPQSYYRYSEDSTLTGIWMVLRNANGSVQTPPSGTNIFLNLVPPTNPVSSVPYVSAIRKVAGTLTYAWSNGGSVASIAVDSTGRYTVTVSDGTCSATASTFVNLNSSLSIHIGNDTAICPSGSVTFNAGAGYSHYAWSNGDTTQTITVSAAGPYSVTVTSGLGCTGSDTAVVTINGRKVDAGADVTRCNNDPVTLSASSGYVLYEWFGTGISSRTYSAVNDGCYWVEATDSSGCTSYDTVCVSTSGVDGLHSHDSLIACTGGSVSFDASVNVNASGDSLVITFDATQNTTSAPLLGASKVYMYSAPQFYPFAPWPANDPYTVGTWGVDNGVGEMTSVGPNKWQITIYPSCYYHFNPDTPFNGIWMVFRNADGSAQAPPSGTNINLYTAGGDTATSPYTGVSGYHKSTNNITYTWSAGVTAAGPVGTITTSGTYYVTASDGTCSKTDSIFVNQSASPTVDLGDDTCVASGTILTLNAGPGFADYLWSTGASTQSIFASQPNTYWVRVTTSAGCVGSDTIVVSNSCNPSGCVTVDFGVINVSPSNTVTFGDSSYNEHGTVTYIWNYGDSTGLDTATAGNSVHSYGQTGIYTVILTIIDSCGASSDTIQVNVNYTGITSIDGLNDVNLYPNPASNTCTMEINATEDLSIDISLTDVVGSTVMDRKAQVVSGKNKILLDLSGISSGMYTVTMRSSSGLLTRKLDIIK